jgi:hypothetical protein
MSVVLSMLSPYRFRANFVHHFHKALLVSISGLRGMLVHPTIFSSVGYGVYKALISSASTQLTPAVLRIIRLWVVTGRVQKPR